MSSVAVLEFAREHLDECDEIEGGPEPVRRLAHRDAERGWVLSPPYVDLSGKTRDSTPFRTDWELWGYEEAKQSPAEDSPERLRERREALGLSPAEVAALIVDPWTAADVEHCERVDCTPESVARYAAALSAEEALRACKRCKKPGVFLDNLCNACRLALAESIHATPERPAPRFKVGDWVRVAQPHSPYYGHVYQVAEIRDGWHRKTVGSSQCSHWVDALEPAAPPAPEVVDVPQPRIVVKRCDEVEAEWTSADATILIVTHDALDDAIFVPIALLRAMLAAIDAQWGGAS